MIGGVGRPKRREVREGKGGRARIGIRVGRWADPDWGS